MQSLASPGDIRDSLLQANRIEARRAQLTRYLGANQDAALEDFLVSADSGLLRPELSIIKALDRNRDAEEERRTGRKATTAFDDILAAKVSAAVGHLAGGTNGIRLDLAADNPFSPASTITQIAPRLNREAMRIAAANGFPVREVFGDLAPLPTVLRSYETSAATSASVSAKGESTRAAARPAARRRPAMPFAAPLAYHRLPYRPR